MTPTQDTLTRAARPGAVRFTKYPATEIGGFARWELTVEETGELLAKGGYPCSDEQIRLACDEYRARFT